MALRTPKHVQRFLLLIVALLGLDVLLAVLVVTLSDKLIAAQAMIWYTLACPPVMLE